MPFFNINIHLSISSSPRSFRIKQITSPPDTDQKLRTLGVSFDHLSKPNYKIIDCPSFCYARHAPNCFQQVISWNDFPECFKSSFKKSASSLVISISRPDLRSFKETTSSSQSPNLKSSSRPSSRASNADRSTARLTRANNSDVVFFSPLNLSGFKID